MEEKNGQKLQRIGALLVHGLHDSVCNMKELAGFLACHDVVTLNVLLPGHGASGCNRLPIDWSESSSVIYKELQKLKQQCKYVFLIGHSLGGALSLHLAASNLVTGIIIFCVPVYMYSWITSSAGSVESFTPVPLKLREDLRGSEVGRRSGVGVHGKPPVTPVESTLHYWPLLRTELPSVTAPILIMTSVDDQVVSTRDARAIYRLIGSQEKYLVMFRRSEHLLVNDADPEEVFARALDFIQSHAG